MPRATRSMRPKSFTGDAARRVSASPKLLLGNSRPGASALGSKHFKKGIAIMANESKCPFSGATHRGTTNRDWWPEQLDLTVLHINPPAADPMGDDFDYAKE